MTFLVKFEFLILTTLLCISSSSNQAADLDVDSTVSFSEILKYADLSSSAYSQDTIIADSCKKYGYTVTLSSTVPDVEVTFFVATNKLQKQHLVVIRGTANVENTIVDLSVKLALDVHTNIKIHSGFALAAKGVFDIIKPILDPNFSIVTTGHSLGGAVAVVLALYLTKNNFNVQQVMTYGQPKVTNLSGAADFRQLNITRIVTANDIVTLIPPVDLLDLKSLDVYWHVGNEILLYNGLEYSNNTMLDSMYRAVKFFKQTPDQEYLTNHRMAFYLERINEKIPQAVLVPYKREGGFFGWFKD